jgi:hypothetical protein
VINTVAGVDTAQVRTATRPGSGSARGRGGLEAIQVVEVDPEKFLAIVEIRAERDRRAMHDHAALLGHVLAGRATRLSLVDAQTLIQRRVSEPIVSGRARG